MTVQELIDYWKNKKDHDGSPAVGIWINWDKISNEAKIIQHFGENAWSKIGDFYTPWWGGFNRTKLKAWLITKRSDYNKFIEEEKSVGKIDLYEKNGIMDMEFFAFSDQTGSLGILGDGSHRYIICNYLIYQGKNFQESINRCRLDILCVPNLNEILSLDDLIVTL